MTQVKIFRGDTPTLQFTLVDTDSSAIDLTGSTVKLVAKIDPSDTDANAIIDSACTITNATGGLCEVKLTTTETATAQRLIADVQANFGAGTTILTALQFELIIQEDVATAI